MARGSGGATVIGPVDQVAFGGDRSANLYLLRFDERGALKSEQTAQQFLREAAGATDVFVFSHGWNNIYQQALDRYRGFIGGYVRTRAARRLPEPDGYRPVLLGIIWPSTSLVLPWEQGPVIAGGDDRGAEKEELLAFVGSSLDEAAGAELAELVDGSAALARQDARRAAEIVLAGLAGPEDPDVGPAQSVDELLLGWRAIDEQTTPAPFVADDDFGTVDDRGAGTPGAEPTAAGGLSFDPRNLLRSATVWKMKARAGTIGARGVAPLLADVLEGKPGGPKPRVHLVGHSFGARVVLSAVAASPLPRNVHSMLLLQPAINRWCFAASVPGSGAKAGYHPVLDRVDRPLVTTYSRFDKPLHDFFHLAVRGSSLGEPDVAAVGDTDRYGALGGYGPAGLGRLATSVPAAPGKALPLSHGFRVVAIDGSVLLGETPAINGHGDISNPVTWSALHGLTEP